MKKGLLLVILFLFSVSLFARHEKLRAEFETLFFSRHLWRGSQFGDAITIEPSLTVEKGTYSFNLWAAKTINKSYAEVDLIFSKSYGDFNLTFYDYYNPVPGEANNYFVLKEGENRHSGELTINYSTNSKMPLDMMLGSFFYGDKNPDTGKLYFSTYVEFSYPVSVKKIEIEPVFGFTTHKGYYADKFAVLNIGVVCSRIFNLGSKWVLPTQLSGIYNPNNRKFYFNFAVGIRLQ